MNLIYYKDKNGNFGDDLNPILFEALCNDREFKSEFSNLSFYAIGSIITEKIKKDSVVVFGTGLRYPYYKIDYSKWDIFFLRGPLSSSFIGKQEYISDAAYCLKTLRPDLFKSKKKEYKISIIPYFKTYDLFPWKHIGNILGVNIINPSDSVYNIINEIAKSERIIAGAMHGAIIADILRVPWLRLRLFAVNAESYFESDFKWIDWLLSINKKNIYIDLFLQKKTTTGKFLFNQISNYELLLRLRKAIKKATFQLSGDTLLDEIDNRMFDKVESFRSKFLS